MSEAPPIHPLFIALPTRDGSAQVLTVQTLLALGAMVGHVPILLVPEASNIPKSRNYIQEYFREQKKAGYWAWWVDSDILLTQNDLPHLQRMMAIAHETRKTVSAHYRRTDGAWQGMATRKRYGSTQVIRKPDVEFWESDGMTGFGCVYGKFDSRYTFHADDIGEDVHYWLDHPGRTLIWYEGDGWNPIHRKDVKLG